MFLMFITQEVKTIDDSYRNPYICNEKSYSKTHF